MASYRSFTVLATSLPVVVPEDRGLVFISTQGNDELAGIPVLV